MPVNHAHPDPAIRPGGPQPSRRPWNTICPLTVTRNRPRQEPICRRASRVMRGDGLATEGLAEAYNIAQFLGRLEDGGSPGRDADSPR